MTQRAHSNGQMATLRVQEASLLMGPELFDPVAWWATVDGPRTAVIDSGDDRRYSYRDVHDAAERWRAMLADQHIGQGARVAILSPNRVEFIALFFACIRAGAILVPLNWRLSGTELARVLVDASPAVVFGDGSMRALFTDACRRCSTTEFDAESVPAWIDFDGDVPVLLRAQNQHATARVRSPARSQDDITMLLYTSGSTGQPKGVMLSHRELLWNAIATTTGWELGPKDIGPVSTPFFHTGGWHVFTTTLLFCGGTVLMIRAFDPTQYFETLVKHGVTVAFCVPTQLAMLQEGAEWGRPLPALRWFLSGGAACPTRVKNAVRAAGYQLREGYGLTECGPNCFATTNETAVAKDGTVGWPVPFLQMRLRRADDTMAGVDDIGELELRGPQLFSGYFRAPETTAEVMTADGWLRTGDLASRDRDGVYRICGRRKEMFISGGENVFPGEVETVVLDCPGVLEVLVIGVADERWGEVGCAIVVARDERLSARDVIAHARTQLASYKVPKRVQFVSAIPRLGSGKMDRRAAAMLIVEGNPAR